MLDKLIFALCSGRAIAVITETTPPGIKYPKVEPTAAGRRHLGDRRCIGQTAEVPISLASGPAYQQHV